MRGGKRLGAGRKAGVPSAKTVNRAKVTEKAAQSGQLPVDVMLANMRHFQTVALDAEAVLEALSAKNLAGAEGDPATQFKLMLAEVKKAAGLRMMAQDCARDAAPYIHPRLAAVEHTGANGEALAIVHRIERVIVDPADTDPARVPATAAAEKVQGG